MAEHRHESGFLLIDVALMMTVAVAVLYALFTGTQSAIQTRKAIELQFKVQAQGMMFVKRLRQIPFGRLPAPAATAEQLTELFDADDDLGSATLASLKVGVHERGLAFSTAGGGVIGEWRVKVTADIDGNGDEAGPRDNRRDLLRIEIFFDDRLVVDTVRAAGPELTQVDAGANYLGH